MTLMSSKLISSLCVTSRIRILQLETRQNCCHSPGKAGNFIFTVKTPQGKKLGSIFQRR